MSGRVPSRSDNAPPTGASSIGITTIGSMCSPASSGSSPSPVCNSWVTRNRAPNSAAYITSAVRFATVKARLRKKRIGSIGAGARSWEATNRTRASAPTLNAAGTSGRAHPTLPALATAQTMPSRPAPLNATPHGSMLRCGPWLSRRRRRASGTSASPSGTFSQKIHCQPTKVARPPPSNGPTAAPRPPIPPHAPSTAPRRCSGVAALSMVSDSGAKIAPPAPWTARAAIRVPTVGARAAAAEPSGEQTHPDREHAAAAEAVAHRGARQQEHDERQRVGVDGPLRTGEVGAEIGSDRGQGGRDHQPVQGEEEPCRAT